MSTPPKRGRSTQRSPRMRTTTRSTSSRSIASARSTGVKRTWPMRQGWNNKLADPFPARQFAILRYSQNITLDASQALPASYVFRANSIFDPDYSGIGHQPYGHDTYQRIYQNYRVKKAVITVSSSSTGANNILGVTHRATPNVITQNENIREVKGTRFTALCNDPASNKIQTSSQLNDAISYDDQSAKFGSNPVDQSYFHVWTASNGAADPTTLAICVDIVYYVDMWSPLALGLS